MFTDVLFLERPGGFDGVEVRRVRRLVEQSNATSGACGRHSAVVVGSQVVQNEHVAGAKLWQKLSFEPLYESVAVGRVPNRAEHDPTLSANRAEKSEVDSAVHRDAVDEFLTAFHPGVASAHRHRQPRLVEKNQAVRVQSANPLQVRRALCDDVGPQTLQRPSALFFTTYPCRRRARFMLDM